MKRWTVFLLISLIILLPVLGLASLSLFSTKPSNLGVINGKLAKCPDSPNCVSTQAEDESKKMDPIAFTGTPESAIEKIKGTLAKMPRVAVTKEKADYIHAEATSMIFRFVDDVEFYVDKDNKVIHFRSASRAGHSDIGVNRARMEKFTELFSEIEE